MGIFGNIFNKSSEKSEKKEVKSAINWIPLTSVSQFEEIKKKSKSKVVGIFKHSTRCVISRTVLKNFDQGFPESVSDKIDMYYYEGGHMMYTHEPDFVKLSKDIREFLKSN